MLGFKNFSKAFEKLCNASGTGGRRRDNSKINFMIFKFSYFQVLSYSKIYLFANHLLNFHKIRLSIFKNL